MSILNTLIEYFQFPFVRYALIAGVLIALCSSLLGVTLVLKRLSFIGDGLSHVAFGAMAVLLAADGRLNDSLFFMAVGMLTSFVDFLTYPIATLGLPLVLRNCAGGG